uniref:Uncharacterized protein n=1 Tax=Arundo donax TaxID=35708 RepID=A0A0A8YLD9_ARUDO
MKHSFSHQDSIKRALIFS